MDFLAYSILPVGLPLSGDRCGPAGGGIMVEVHVGPLHVVDFQQPLQCTVRPRRHRSRHRGVRTLRLLRHLQGPSLDAKPGLSPLLPVAEEYAELEQI